MSDIPAGDCDCDGNQLDALGVCGGDVRQTPMQMASVTTSTIDTADACGVCNGPGAIYECGCSDIPAGDCDCDGNQLDALGVCGGDCAADANGNGVCDDAEIPDAPTMQRATTTQTPPKMTAPATSALVPVPAITP